MEKATAGVQRSTETVRAREEVSLASLRFERLGDPWPIKPSHSVRQLRVAINGALHDVLMGHIKRGYVRVPIRSRRRRASWRTSKRGVRFAHDRSTSRRTEKGKAVYCGHSSVCLRPYADARNARDVGQFAQLGRYAVATGIRGIFASSTSGMARCPKPIICPDGGPTVPP